MSVIEIRGVEGIPEIADGDDLARIIATHAPDLRDGDIVVVTSKVVSKSEGRVVGGDDREAAIEAETVRIIARRGATRIVETRHGLVLAAAGVDASNVPRGTIALLPLDPDASAARLRDGLRTSRGVDVGILITDTMGRPWRNGLVDVAIGAAGVAVLDDHRGRVDENGHTLEMTVTALADELAAAAELAKGKLDRVPVAIVRGLGHLVGDGTDRARDLIRPAGEDMFRYGAREALRAIAEAVGESGVALVPSGTSGRVVICLPAAQRPAPELPAWLGELAPPRPSDPPPPDGWVAVAALDP